MGQATLDDEDLFGEATEELRGDVIAHLDAAEQALPDAKAIWTVDSNNVLGVMNTLRANLELDEARGHLRDAKKWLAVADRAEMFDEDDDLSGRLDELESTIEQAATIHDKVADVAGTLPALRERLQPREESEIAAT